MVFINEAYKVDSIPQAYVEGFLKILSPVVPHIAEEIWEKLGYTDTITYEEWPTFDETKLVDDTVEIAVQINGKVRARIIVAIDSTKEELEKIALEDADVKAFLDGKDVKKVIGIPGRLVNIVAK